MSVINLRCRAGSAGLEIVICFVKPYLVCLGKIPALF